MTMLEALRDADHQAVTRDGIRCGALFSGDHRYRYYLTRIWAPGKGVARFVGLNPSTATHEHDDPTIRRCMRFARDWGCGGIMMLNIFAYRSTDPSALLTAPEPVGELNDYHLATLGGADPWSPIVACWGVHGELYGRGAEVYAVLKRTSRDRVQAFGFTKAGYPKHPLYLRADTELVPWR